MLSRSEIAKTITGIEEIYTKIEDDMLRNIAKRLNAVDDITTDNLGAWQLQKLNEAGGLRKDNIKAIASMSKKSEAELTRIITAAGYRSVLEDDKIYNAAYQAGALPTKPVIAKASPKVNAVLEAAIRNSKGTFNLVNTTAIESASAKYIMAVNKAYIETATGVVDYRTAINRAVKEIADSGIKGATYVSASGRVTTTTLDVAVRRSVLSTSSKCAADMQLARADDWGVDLVEISSHAGARPSHAEWQGQILSRSGNHKKYKPFSITRYGEIDGLGGVNCSHVFYPFIEGISEQTYKPVPEEKNEQAYKDSQKQRAMERDIRREKRRAAILTDPEEIKKTNEMIKQKQMKYRDFSKSVGRVPRPERTLVVQ